MMPNLGMKPLDWITYPIPVRPDELIYLHSVHDFRALIKRIVRRCEEASEPIQIETLRTLKASMLRARPIPTVHDCPSAQIARINGRRAWVDRYIRGTDLRDIWESI